MRVFIIEANRVHVFGEYPFGSILADFLVAFYCDLMKIKAATKIYKKMLKFLEDMTIN